MDFGGTLQGIKIELLVFFVIEEGRQSPEPCWLQARVGQCFGFIFLKGHQ